MKHILTISIALMISGCLVPAKEEIPWTPPPKDVVDMDDPNVVFGRLWLAPNPIPLHPNEYGDVMISIAIAKLGTEAVTVDAMTVEGPIDYECGAIDDPSMFPWTRSAVECCWTTNCGLGGHWGTMIDFHVPEGYDGGGWFVVHTSDPTSPTLRVPIIVDDGGRYALEPYSIEYDIHDWDFVWTTPNPIRIGSLPAGESTTLDVCLTSRGGPQYTNITVWGPDLTLSGMYDMDGALVSVPVPEGSSGPAMLEVTYSSSGIGLVDGALLITYINRYGDEFTQGFPIMVRD